MNTLRKLSVATAGSALIVGISAAQAVTLSSAELGNTGEKWWFYY